MEPRNVTALVGEATSLKCLAHGNPPPTITWARHGIGNGSELFFPSAKFSDSGWYRCVATNAYGVSFSPLAYLDVTGKVLDPSCGRIKIVRIAVLSNFIGSFYSLDSASTFINGRMTILNENFDNGLENPSSARYQTLKRQFVEAVSV